MNKYKIMRYVALACIILVFLGVFTGEKIEKKYIKVKGDLWNENWTQILDGEEINLDNPMDFTAVSVGETLVLTNEVPELFTSRVLLFYSKDLEINIFVEDENIYSFEMQENFEFLKTPGHLWNEVEIPMEYSGKTIRIELTSQFSNRFMGTLNELYFVEEYAVASVLLHEEVLRLFIALIMIITTSSAYINAIVWKRKRLKKYFLYLGNFYLSATLWLCGMIGAFTYFLKQPILNMLICNVMILVIPVAVYEFYNFIFEGDHVVLKVLKNLVWLNFWAQFILQFVFGVSILSMLPISYIIYVIGSILAFLLVIQYLFKYRKYNREIFNFPLVSTLIFFLGAAIEILVLCLFPKRTDLIGISGIIGASLYMIINRIVIASFSSGIDIQKQKIEGEYHELQNITLVEEIKAHFFYNTLNSISALCKTDVDAADLAIQDFAKYMRSYMHLINEKKNIPITRELELLKATLELEKMRFFDKFEYTIDLEYIDFDIPPLSLQPIVENAIFHGFRQKQDKGIVNISIFEEENYVYIKISDNGVGFDIKILEKDDSIALRNLKRRIAIMAGGTLDIASEIGIGTMVVIRIPL
ncbi:MAG: histidine kinase [Lachnospiraceae bacterium]